MAISIILSSLYRNCPLTFNSFVYLFSTSYFVIVSLSNFCCEHSLVDVLSETDILSSFLPSLLTCLLACFLVCLLACLFACLLGCWLAGWLARLLACLLACLLTYLLTYLLTSASSKEFLDIQETIERGFTPKCVRDMARTCSL